MKRLVGYIAMMAILLVAASAQAEKLSRDFVVMPKVPAGSVPIGGVYRALIVGIEHQ